ncbi:putative aldo keto protein [Botrytis fragariae]|uniref:Putative aldo keto protein n=1 Tax=Botrytis fragariae TaxID=1964551 RepID=A0A8H6AM09_9HELO|nr:putative aldo keto protein [Botrytis fragariae]KAF5869773.1 putative aldo keto protein [Botrytis fragariae]
MSHPSLIFGAASFGMDFSTKESVQDALEVLKELNISQIDTAGRYPPTNHGRSEELLGRVGATSQGFSISTKILATKLGYGSGELEASAIKKSLDTSFKRLGVDQVDILYCHQPDPTTPLKDQAEVLNNHFKNGSFKRLGVSNFPPKLLQDFIQVCEENGFVKPSVYQGDYNLITRGMEKELLPIFRANSMSFFAFRQVACLLPIRPTTNQNHIRALAAGFLTGNYSAGKSNGTRFSDDHPLGKAFQNLYGAPKLQQAMKDLENNLAPLGISGREASLRWIYHHSKLGDGDGIILGASKISQIRENVESISVGPLSEEVVQKIEGIWDLLAEDRGGIL